MWSVSTVRKYFKMVVYRNIADELNILRITYGPLFPSLPVESAKWFSCLEVVQSDGKYYVIRK